MDMENINQIEQLINEIQTISQSYSRVAEATGENFNIFSILNIETDEVYTHSRFLAELLNPKGQHRQKDLFLNKFIECIGINDFNTNNSRVYTEYYIGQITKDFTNGGRIDILIENKDNQVIMIENKIYAEEQKNQLLRYHNKFPSGKLIYLTLFGEASTEKSLKNIEYKIISYKTDIINWLEECRKIAVNVPILRETISQYINLTKQLTNQNLNKKMSQAIINRVLRDENSFQSFISLVHSRNEIFKSIVSEKLFSLIDSLSEKYALEVEMNKSSFFESSKKYKEFSFLNEKLDIQNLKITFSFNVPSGFKDFIYGFKYLDNDLKQNYDYKQVKDRFNDSFGKSFETQNGPCFNNWEEYSNWEDLSTLKKIKFTDFETDFEQKLKAMLEIIEII